MTFHGFSIGSCKNYGYAEREQDLLTLQQDKPCLFTRERGGRAQGGD